METFPLPYTFEITKDTKYATTTVKFQSQKKQVQRNAVQPSISWKINVKGSVDNHKTLESFHDRMGGNAVPFYFLDENLVQQKVRFAEQGMSVKLLREFTLDNPTHGKVVGFTADITLEREV